MRFSGKKIEKWRMLHTKPGLNLCKVENENMYMGREQLNHRIKHGKICEKPTIKGGNPT